MTNYPYIQSFRHQQNLSECPICKEKHTCLNIEWRVDMFQGNCEFEKICIECSKRKYPELKLGKKTLENEAKWVVNAKTKADKEAKFIAKIREELIDDIARNQGWEETEDYYRQKYGLPLKWNKPSSTL